MELFSYLKADTAIMVEGRKMWNTKIGRGGETRSRFFFKEMLKPLSQPKWCFHKLEDNFDIVIISTSIKGLLSSPKYQFSIMASQLKVSSVQWALGWWMTPQWLKNCSEIMIWCSLWMRETTQTAAKWRSNETLEHTFLPWQPRFKK